MRKTLKRRVTELRYGWTSAQELRYKFQKNSLFSVQINFGTRDERTQTRLRTWVRVRVRVRSRLGHGHIVFWDFGLGHGLGQAYVRKPRTQARTRTNFGHACPLISGADLGSLISHSISGKEIQEIYFDENTLINTERIPLASFETLQLTTNPNPRADNHSCICVKYQPRKVHKSKVKLSVFRLYSLQGRGRTADQKTLQPKLIGQLCYELLKAKLW